MQYKLVYDPSKIHFEECCRVLKEGVKYKFLSYEEAKEKAKFIKKIDNAMVTYGYNDVLYEIRKGLLPYVRVIKGVSDFRLEHYPEGFAVSLDMLEPYRRDIKYNKEFL